jgi:hypothetical protein
MLHKKFFAFLFAVFIIPVCITAQNDQDRIEKSCKWLLEEDIELKDTQIAVTALLAEIKAHADRYLKGGHYQKIREGYEALLEKMGDYYYYHKYYSVATRYYTEAKKHGFSKQTHQKKINKCHEALRTDIDKKEFPPGDCKKIVFVVDVSYKLREFFPGILKFVEKVYREYLNISKNDFHLITFSQRAKLYPPEAIDEIEKIKEIISNDSKQKFSFRYPKHGLGGVFDLVAEKFPQKVGIVIFISDGQDSRGSSSYVYKDLGRTIKAIKKNGFVVFSIFIDSGENTLEHREYMKKLAKYAKTIPLEITNINQVDDVVRDLKKQVVEKAGFCSPVPREIHEVEKKEK